MKKTSILFAAVTATMLLAACKDAQEVQPDVVGPDENLIDIEEPVEGAPIDDEYTDDYVDEITEGAADEYEGLESESLTKYIGVSEELEGYMDIKMAQTEANLANVNIDPDYKRFIMGDAFMTLFYDDDNYVSFSSSTLFDELMPQFLESETAFALIDVNGDGVDELYYTVTDYNTYTAYSALIGKENDLMKVYWFDETHNLSYGSRLTSEGYWIEENTMSEAAYYTVNMFNQNGEMEFVEGCYMEHCDTEEYYYSRVDAMWELYENGCSINMTKLSDSVEM